MPTSQPSNAKPNSRLCRPSYAYRLVMRRGAEPFPTAPDSDLPSVLKALYLQQAFTRFALDSQGLEPSALHAAFGRFLAEHKPADVSGPTQGPGVVRTLAPKPVAPLPTAGPAPKAPAAVVF